MQGQDLERKTGGAAMHYWEPIKAYAEGSRTNHT